MHLKCIDPRKMQSLIHLKCIAVFKNCGFQNVVVISVMLTDFNFLVWHKSHWLEMKQIWLFIDVTGVNIHRYNSSKYLFFFAVQFLQFEQKISLPPVLLKRQSFVREICYNFYFCKIWISIDLGKIFYFIWAWVRQPRMKTLHWDFVLNSC